MNNKIKILNSLNDQQKKVVKNIDGKILVLAGAGSGKTNTIVSRISYLILNNIEPKSILTLTFTNKAANEMKERTIKQLNDLNVNLTSNPELKTFHSWGLNFLSLYYNRIGLKENWTICNEDKQKKILKDLILRFKLLNNKNINDIINLYSMFQNFLIHDYFSFNDMKIKISKFINKQKENNEDTSWLSDYIFTSEELNEVIRLFIFYKKTLISQNLVDFDDLINLSIKILEDDLDIQNKIKKIYKYVMVDEYQDTNNAQNKLLDFLSINNNLCVVGDDNQSIYSWRGSDISYILNFNKHHKNVKVFSLKINYRSSSNILGIANKLINNSSSRHELKENLTSFYKHKGIIQVISGKNEKDEFKKIVEEIKRLNKYENKKFSEITILFRYKSLTLSLEKELLENRIPYKFKNNNSLIEKKEIKGIINVLNIIINNKDNQALIEILLNFLKGFGKKTIEKLVELSIKENKSLFEICQDELLLKNLNIISREKQFDDLKELIEKIHILSKEYLKLKKNEDIGSFVLLMESLFKFKTFYTSKIVPSREEIIDLNEIDKNIVLKSNHKDLDEFTLNMLIKKRIYNIELFYSLLEDVKNINKFLISLNLENNDDSNMDSVNLMTIHSSKGLEFDTVFIIRLNKGIFPIEQSLKNKNKFEEELRLMYVAITRAKKNLYFSYSKMKFSLKVKKEIKIEPSLFLKNILKNKKENHE